ncbi:MAG: DUF938 domain-containing protein [Bdellovibrionota bacterium]
MDAPLPPSSNSPNMDQLLKIFRELIPAEHWRILEIGTGSGHHAVYIASELRQLQWVCSDVPFRQKAIKNTLKEAKLQNVHGPLEFTVGKDEFPNQKFNAAFASQLLHVISWKETKSLIKMLGGRLRQGSQVMFYGPFKYDGKFSSERQEELDRMLKEKDPLNGIRSFEDVVRTMEKAGFAFKKDFALPNENHLLYFERLLHVENES